MSTLVEELRAGKAVAPVRRWVGVIPGIGLVIFAVANSWLTLEWVVSGKPWTKTALLAFLWLLVVWLAGWGHMQLFRLKRARVQVTAEGFSYTDPEGKEHRVPWSSVRRLVMQRWTYRAPVLRLEYGSEQAPQTVTLPWIERWNQGLLAVVIETIRERAGLEAETRSSRLRVPWANTVSYHKPNAAAS